MLGERMVDVVGARVYGTDACCPIRECSDRLPSARACAVKARYVCGAHAIQTALWHKPHPSLTEICGQEQGGEISAHPADRTPELGRHNLDGNLEQYRTVP